MEGYYNNSVVGVRYNESATRWAIQNQDFVAMPVGVSFNVTVLPEYPATWAHRASATNTTDNWTAIDNPLTNNNPNAIVSVTQRWNLSPWAGVLQ